jgi:formyltetrahydrofolate deformylase
LVVSCPDRHGIIAAVAGLLSDLGANIVASDQHSTDPEGGRFFLRTEFHLDGLDGARDELERRFRYEAQLLLPTTPIVELPDTRRVRAPLED